MGRGEEKEEAKSEEGASSCRGKSLCQTDEVCCRVFGEKFCTLLLLFDCNVNMSWSLKIKRRFVVTGGADRNFAA